MGGTPNTSAGMPGQPDPLSTAVLLRRVREGDKDACNELFRRYYPRLMRIAHGRIPHNARDGIETADVVQKTVIRAFTHLDGFEPEHEGAFLAWLRKILLNQVRDEIRRVSTRPTRTELPDQLSSPELSPLEKLIGKENMEAYERALGRLKPLEREAVILRIEFRYTYEAIAEALQKPSANAARMYVVRALRKLASFL